MKMNSVTVVIDGEQLEAQISDVWINGVKFVRSQVPLLDDAQLCEVRRAFGRHGQSVTTDNFTRIPKDDLVERAMQALDSASAVIKRNTES